MNRFLLVFTALAICAGPLAHSQRAPDLVILNARVFTGVAAQPWAEALAISGERIAAVGTTSDIRAQAGAATRVIDGAGRLVIPGINDAHAHPGARPRSTDLEGPPAVEHDPTLGEILERLKAAVPKAPKGRWIFGEIGSAVLDDPKAVRFALDAVAPDHLVALGAWTGHGVLLNTPALRRLGVKDDEPDPPGGFYVRMPGSRTISGIAHEYADWILGRRIAMEPARDAQIAAFRRFGQEAAALGITSVQVMLTALPATDAVKILAAADLPVRLRLIDFPLTAMSDWRGPTSRAVRGSAPVTVSGTKWVMDGTPIERLAFMREPYADRPETRGRLNFTAADLTGFLERAMAAGEQPSLHVVGDASIDTLLDGLDRSGGERWQALRPRIEHGDMLEPAHFARARRLGVILVQNPSHVMLRDIGVARFGPRLARTDMLKSTIAAGVPVALGSDGPLHPFLNVMFASTNAINPKEAMTREQALAAYTHGAAFAEFQEKEKGTLAAGMLADLAMLSQDIFMVPAETLPATTSLLTIVGGRVVYEREKRAMRF